MILSLFLLNLASADPLQCTLPYPFKDTKDPNRQLMTSTCDQDTEWNYLGVTNSLKKWIRSIELVRELLLIKALIIN